MSDKDSLKDITRIKEILTKKKVWTEKGKQELFLQYYKKKRWKNMRNIIDYLKGKFSGGKEKERQWYGRGLAYQHLARYGGTDVMSNYRKAIKCYKKAPHIAEAGVGSANCFEGLSDRGKAWEIRNWVDSNSEKLISA